MSKRHYFLEVVPPFPCFFGCGSALTSKYDRRVIDGWEWFTGYGRYNWPASRPARRLDSVYLGHEEINA